MLNSCFGISAQIIMLSLINFVKGTGSPCFLPLEPGDLWERTIIQCWDLARAAANGGRC